MVASVAIPRLCPCGQDISLRNGKLKDKCETETTQLYQGREVELTTLQRVEKVPSILRLSSAKTNSISLGTTTVSFSISTRTHAAPDTLFDRKHLGGLRYKKRGRPTCHCDVTIGVARILSGGALFVTKKLTTFF